MRVYIAGPMSGYKDYNYLAFNKAKAVLEAIGHAVESPADGGQVDGWGWSDYMRRGLAQLLTCVAIVTLPGWSESKGASLERGLASSLGMRVCDIGDLIAMEASGEQVAEECPEPRTPASVGPEIVTWNTTTEDRN